jgi:hypothetical protein
MTHQPDFRVRTALSKVVTRAFVVGSDPQTDDVPWCPLT